MQEAINRGILAVAPCIGTDQMGPKRFGAKGKLAFSFGNVAQDEGSAMAQYAWGRGWKTAALATDNVIVYFKNITAGVHGPLQAARRQDRRPGDLPGSGFHGNNVENAVSRLNDVKADVIVTVDRRRVRRARAAHHGTAHARQQHADPELVGRRRDYWLPKSPAVTNYYFVTYASVFGDDPNPGGQHAGEEGPRRRPAASSRARPRSTASSTAIKRANGSTKGAVLAAVMEKFKKVPTLSGLVSFSPTLHTVFGRQYRVIKIQDNKPHVVGEVVAKVVVKI